METLLQKTLRLLRETETPVSVICAATELKPRWVYRLMDGDYRDPGVNKIEALHNYLTGDHSADTKQEAA